MHTIPFSCICFLTTHSWFADNVKRRSSYAWFIQCNWRSSCHRYSVSKWKGDTSDEVEPKHVNDNFLIYEITSLCWPLNRLLSLVELIGKCSWNVRIFHLLSLTILESMQQLEIIWKIFQKFGTQRIISGKCRFQPYRLRSHRKWMIQAVIKVVVEGRKGMKKVGETVGHHVTPPYHRTVLVLSPFSAIIKRVVCSPCWILMNSIKHNRFSVYLSLL